MENNEIKTVGIVSKPHAPQVAKLIPKIVDILEKAGSAVLVDKESETLFEGRFDCVSRGKIVDRSDMIIVLGGDGTLLSLAQYHSGREVPILGINMGSLGFLTEIAAPQALDQIRDAIRGELVRSYRMMLEVDMIRHDDVHTNPPVLNDLVINKSALARMLDIDVILNGEKITTIRADGIIVSTPTGSTAYNLAANGPIVHPDMDVILLTPICPHMLTYRPIVLPGDMEVELGLSGGEETYLTLDGQHGFPLEIGDLVRVRRSERRLCLLSPKGKSYFDVLRTKLKWGER